MSRPSVAFPAACLLLLVLAHGAGANSTPGPPQALRATYDDHVDEVTLSWQSPDGGTGYVYRVYRDATLLGKTEALTFRDTGIVPSDPYVYFVTAARGDSGWSDPAVAAVPTLACEVFSLTLSYDYPFVYAHVHQECVGGVVTDKHVTWTA